jgi:hypothetical protein
MPMPRADYTTPIRRRQSALSPQVTLTLLLVAVFALGCALGLVVR